MLEGTVPPAGIGLVTGLATAAIAIALTATGLLPVWISTPLLFLAPGLAAGLAAPVRPTIGAVLGGVTGVVAGLLQAAVMVAQWTPVPGQYVTPPPLFIIALALVIFYVPVYAIAGAAGAVLRARLLSAGPPARRPFERRQWAGITAGALIIAVPLVLEVVVAPRLGIWIQGDTMNALFLVSGLAGGVAAGVLSPGGTRAGAASGWLSAVFGLGAIALYFIAQASMSPATGDGVPEGLWPIAIMILGVWVLPAAVLAGALGGSVRPAGGSPELEL